MNHIIGLDPSLTATGWARHENGALTFGTLAKLPNEGIARVMGIRQEVLQQIFPGCALVVIEGLSLGSNDPSAQERAYLHYSIRESLEVQCVRCVVVPPTTLKKFVTGSGSAKKEHMLLEVYKRWGFSPNDNNAADAIGLCVIGACLMGEMQPTIEPQREVLAVLRRQMVAGVAA